MKIEVFDGDVAVARRPAAVIAENARHAVAERGKFLMAVSGGKTPWIMLRDPADEEVPGNMSTYFRSMSGSLLPAIPIAIRRIFERACCRDHMNILCMGDRTVGPLVGWDMVETFLDARFNQEPRHLGGLGKVANAEAGNCC
jgi:hypothetical protein